MQDIFTSLSTYGYIFLFLYTLGGGFLALIASGVLSYTGQMDINISIIIAIIANFLGDMGLFYLAKNNKKQIYAYIKKHRRKLALSHIFIKKYGSKVIFIQKFIYGIKTLVPIAIGLSSYDIKKFTIYNFIASIFWAVSIGYTSYLSGKILINFYENIVYNNPYLSPLILISILVLIYIYLNKYTKKVKK